MKKKRLSIALSFIIMAIAVTFGCLTAFADSHIHDMNITVVEATCTKQGYTYYECKGCDFKFKSDFTPINESNHNYVVKNQKKATCTQDGYTGDAVCEYCGNVASKGKLVPKSASIRRSATTIFYTGNVQRPSITVYDRNGKQLTYKKDFTVDYSNWNSTNPGKYTVTVRMIGNFDDVRTYTYYIVKPVLSSTRLTRSGKTLRPLVTVMGPYGENLVYKKDFTVDYSNWNSKEVGEYKVTVKLIGKYSGSKTYTYQIRPKGTSVKSVSSTTNSITCNINPQKTATTGYRVQCSSDKNFNNDVKNIWVKNNKSSVNFTDLTPCKTYYVRVVTYKTVGKTNYYANGWSAAVTINTKTPNYPTTPSNLTLKVNKNTITATWGASKYTTGYEVQWATKNDFSNSKNAWVNSASNTSKTITGMAYDTKYNVRVRAYHTVNGKNYYGSWVTSSATTQKKNVTYVHFLDKNNDLTVEPKYSWECSYEGYIHNNMYSYYTIDQIQFMKSECVSIGNNIKSQLSTNATAYEKIYFIQEWFRNNLTYDLEYNTGRKYPNNTDIYNAYKYRRTTCGGYAYMFNDLCKYLGVTAYYVTGYVPDGYHAWNIFVVDGYAYEIDPRLSEVFISKSDNYFMIDKIYNVYWNYYKKPNYEINFVNTQEDFTSCRNATYRLNAVEEHYKNTGNFWNEMKDNPELWKVDKKLNDAAKSAANKYNKNQFNFYNRRSTTSAEKFYDKNHYLDNEMVEYEIQTFDLGFAFVPSDFLNEDGTFNHEKAEKFVSLSKKWIDKGFHFDYKSRKCYYFLSDSDSSYSIVLDVSQL